MIHTKLYCLGPITIEENGLLITETEPMNETCAMATPVEMKVSDDSVYAEGILKALRQSKHITKSGLIVGVAGWDDDQIIVAKNPLDQRTTEGIRLDKDDALELSRLAQLAKEQANKRDATNRIDTLGYVLDKVNKED